MLKITSKLLKFNKKRLLLNKTLTTATYEYNFDGEEEILENSLGNVLLIGINLPDSKNVLTETAVEKLCETLKKFNERKDSVAGILHGCGGNFCSGLVPTEKALEKSKEIIQVLNSRKKPILAALSGYTTNYGFHLATMCDMRAIEVPALISLGKKNERMEISDIVYQRFLISVGLTKGAEFILTNCTWNGNFAVEVGFANRVVPCGSALGQTVVWAKSIALSPLETIIKDRERLLSFFK